MQSYWRNDYFMLRSFHMPWKDVLNQISLCPLLCYLCCAHICSSKDIWMCK